MSHFRIHGGIPLEGTVRVGGSKNATLPMMAAALLTDEPLRLDGAARLTDVDTLGRLLEELGVEVRRTDHGRLTLRTVDPRPVRARYGLLRRMRAGFCVLGPLLARRGRAVVSLPGGCRIGPRPVDLHLAGLAALGAEFKLRRGYIVGRAGRLVGAAVRLAGRNGPTVTGTANVLSAAVLAEGQTTIHDAAAEPEIVDLGRLLIQMGARIEGLGTSRLTIQGVDRLGGATHRVIPDRIEAATLLLAVAAAGGRATVAGLAPEHLDAVLAMLQAVGARLEVAADSVTIESDGRPAAVDIAACPYPGVPTDVQAQWTALLSLGRGRSTIEDNVFPRRFGHVDELNRLGARIEAADGRAIVRGVRRLTGARVVATDLRASAALVLAGLAARGQTTVHAIHHLDRGYERLDRKLIALGARIERVEAALARNPPQTVGWQGRCPGV